MFSRIESLSFNKKNTHDELEFINCKYVHRAKRLIHIELKARFKADIGK